MLKKEAGEVDVVRFAGAAAVEGARTLVVRCIHIGPGPEKRGDDTVKALAGGAR